jgi:uncharacterized protein YbbK (DUF523 family)/uncharacterized protein YbgA (DUF1722 family)
VEKPNILVSSCLLGNKVRYNGGHTKSDSLLALEPFVNFIPICPEVDMGMPVPRKTLRVVEGELIDSEEVNWTAKAKAKFHEYKLEIDWDNIHGMILMKKSPSCGLERVKQYQKGSKQHLEMGQGYFAKRLRENFPHIPYLDSGRLESKSLRNNFLIQLFSYYRFRKTPQTVAFLQEFHKAHKYLLMDKSQIGLTKLGQLVAGARKDNLHESFEAYLEGFMENMRKVDTSKKKLNTLYHLMGYLKKDLPKDDKEFLLKLFEECRANQSRLAELEKLIHFLVNKFKVNYLLDQNYFEPYPVELRS